MLFACETTAAVVLHVREGRPDSIRLSGHKRPWPKALCGADIAWDTKIPPEALYIDRGVNPCYQCLRALKRH
jgi:hypothetical protein